MFASLFQHAGHAVSTLRLLDGHHAGSGARVPHHVVRLEGLLPLPARLAVPAGGRHHLLRLPEARALLLQPRHWSQGEEAGLSPDWIKFEDLVIKRV